MGSGFGHFAFRSTDSVGNVGSNIVSGGQLELYNTALPSPPDAPTGLTAKSLPGGYVQLSWNAVSNAQIYRLYREAGTNFVIPAILDLDDITNTTVTDLPPVDGDYSYGISASRLGSRAPFPTPSSVCLIARLPMRRPMSWSNWPPPAFRSPGRNRLAAKPRIITTSTVTGLLFKLSLPSPPSPTIRRAAQTPTLSRHPMPSATKAQAHRPKSCCWSARPPASRSWQRKGRPR